MEEKACGGPELRCWGCILTCCLSLGSPFASLNHFLTGKTGWQFLLPGLMCGLRRWCVEGARFLNACSQALCRPTSVTILPKDAEHPKLPMLPGPGGSHSWGAGTGDGSALPSPSSCGMRTGVRVGSCPSPGSPTPALPLMPGIFSCGGVPSSYFGLSSRSQLRWRFLQEALWDSQPEVWAHLHPAFLLWVLIAPDFPFTHLLL